MKDFGRQNSKQFVLLVNKDRLQNKQEEMDIEEYNECFLAKQLSVAFI